MRWDFVYGHNSISLPENYVMTDSPAEFEALMLRLWARHVRDRCARAGEPVPPGAAAILDHYTPDKQVADTDAFYEWCDVSGLEFPVIDGLRTPDVGAAGPAAP